MNKSKGGDSSDDDDDLDDAVGDGSSKAKCNTANKNTETSNNSDCSDISIVEVPDDFIFPGYMAFRLWGPFASPEDRLTIFENADAPKNAGAIGRAAKQKIDLEIKEHDRSSDQQSNHGFSTDQRIIIEGLLVQKKIQKQQEIESSMVALIAYDRSIARQIESAERRAGLRCNPYDRNNIHWKAVDELIEKQTAITEKMGNLTSVGKDEDTGVDSIVTEFLNQQRPQKKRKTTTINIADSDGVEGGDRDGREDGGLLDVSSTSN